MLAEAGTTRQVRRGHPPADSDTSIGIFKTTSNLVLSCEQAPTSTSLSCLSPAPPNYQNGLHQ